MLDLTFLTTLTWQQIVGAVILASTIGFLSYWLMGRMRAQINLDRKINRVSGTKLSSEETLRLLEHQKSEVVDDTLVRLLPSVLGSTRQNLRRAGINLDIKLYILALISLTFVILQIKSLPSVPDWAQPLILMAAIHFVTDRFLLRFLIERRKLKIIGQLGMMVEYIVRGIQVGQSVERAMTEASESLEDPLKREIMAVRRLLELGVPLVDSLQAVATDIDLPEFDFFVSAVRAQEESGGNLRDALTNLTELIRARHQLKLKVEALTAEGKISALVLAALPILLFIYMSTTRPEYVEPLYESAAGPYVLYGSFALVAIGTYVMLRIVKIRV